MHPFAWWALLAPAALLAVSLTPSGAANAHPRAMAATGLSAGIVAFLVAIGVDAAVILYGPFWTGTLGVAGVGVGIYFDALSAAMIDARLLHRRRSSCFTAATIWTAIAGRERFSRGWPLPSPRC